INIAADPTSAQGRILVVVQPDCGERIRLISARRATKRERTQDEETKTWGSRGFGARACHDHERGVDVRIGVIGAGSMGGILARHLARLDHHVSIASSRGLESLTALAAELGATPASVVDAAKAAEVVILAIPTKAVAGLPRG